MLILTARFLVMIGLPIAAVFVWQRRSRAAWSCVFFAFATYAIGYAVRWTDPFYGFVGLPHLFISFVPQPLADRIWAEYMGLPSLIANGVIYGLISLGVRWLMLRFVATTVRSWEEGVLFGLGWSVAVALAGLGGSIYRQYVLNYIVSFPPPSGNMIDILNDAYRWESALYLALDWGPPVMIFSVGTSVAVLFSVRRRQIWLFLAALLLYVISAVAGSKFVFSLRDVDMAISPILEWLETLNLREPTSLLLDHLLYPLLLYHSPLLHFLAALPALWLALRLRKSWKILDSQKEDVEIDKLTLPVIFNVVTMTALVFALVQMLSAESYRMMPMMMVTTVTAITANVIANYLGRRGQRVNIGKIRRLETELDRLRTGRP